MRGVALLGYNELTMRVLLITPPGGFTSKDAMPPLGLLSLAAVLRQAGHRVAVADYAGGRAGRRALARDLKRLRPDALGITVLTESRFAAAAAARLARRVAPGIRVIVGGPHPSGAPEDSVRCPDFDVVVTGQAETVIAEALAGHGRIVHGRAPEHLDDLPMPARDLLPPGERLFPLDLPGHGTLPAGHLITSRGCPFTCAFCATRRTHGPRRQAHSIVRVTAEIDELVRCGARALWFYDDVFNASDDRVAALCDALRRRKGSTAGQGRPWHTFLPFVASIRPDLATRDQLAMMREAGCARVFFGVESANEDVLRDAVGKACSVEQSLAVARWCDELGIEKNPGYILGLPGETPADARRTLDLMRRIGGRPAVSFLRVYPGTRVAGRAVERGLLPAGFSWWDRRALRHLVCRPAFGDTPLFLDGLSWRDVGALAAAWGDIADEPVRRRGRRALVRVRNVSDLAHLISMARGSVSAGKDFRSLEDFGSLGDARKTRAAGNRSALRRVSAAARAGAAAARRGQPTDGPLEVWIEPTNRCPGGCALCPNGVRTLGPVGGPDALATDLLDRIIPALEQWRPHVNLHHRGEPFLHPRIVEMIRAVTATGAPTSLHTSAHVPLPASADAILSAGLGDLVISLGAATPEGFAALRPGACRQTVLATARDLLAAGRNAPTRTIIEVFETRTAGREIEACRALFASAPPAAVRRRPIHNWAGAILRCQEPPHGAVPDTLKTDSRCLFPFYAMVILCDGRVTACPQDFDAHLVVGDLNTSSLDAIWRGDALRRLRERTRRDLAAMAPCRSCSLVRRRGVLGFPAGAVAAFGRRKVLAR